MMPHEIRTFTRERVYLRKTILVNPSTKSIEFRKRWAKEFRESLDRRLFFGDAKDAGPS